MLSLVTSYNVGIWICSKVTKYRYLVYQSLLYVRLNDDELRKIGTSIYLSETRQTMNINQLQSIDLSIVAIATESLRHHDPNVLYASHISSRLDLLK
jgi:hypothetical protein